jgi:hypothetical protein
MNAQDPIILTAYLLCIAFFLFKITEAFNDEFSIELDGDALKEALADQNLKDLNFSFRFDKRYEFKKLKQLNLTVENKSSDYAVFIDWDHSAFTDLDMKARRVTRLMPGNTMDLFQEQVYSAIAPGTSLKEVITAEDLLKRKGGDKPGDLEFTVDKPLIDLSQPNPKKAAKAYERWDKFMRREKKLEFFLEVALRVVGPNTLPAGNPARIRCKFVMEKLPWQAGLPWNPKN